LGVQIDEIRIGSNSLRSLLEADLNDLEALGLTTDQYFTLMKSFIDTINSNDFDPNDIPGMFKLLGQNLNEEFTINTDSFSLRVTPSGDYFFIDW
jgi:hypothetical protein